MSKKIHKCKAPGCGKWVVQETESNFCNDHLRKVDPLSALYVDKSAEEIESDQRTVNFFSYLLQNHTLEELL
jgi:hypothetical protein